MKRCVSTWAAARVPGLTTGAGWQVSTAASSAQDEALVVVCVAEAESMATAYRIPLPAICSRRPSTRVREAALCPFHSTSTSTRRYEEDEGQEGDDEQEYVLRVPPVLLVPFPMDVRNVLDGNLLFVCLCAILDASRVFHPVSPTRRQLARGALHRHCGRATTPDARATTLSRDRVTEQRDGSSHRGFHSVPHTRHGRLHGVG